ncbi:GMC oxidoreductase [Mycolicibacterium rhodesiae]|uniref:Glucose-methanol-choline oxidoreductase n=1 Tax=Mycolicibacterium rhodesiae TaxID=36814 RepID=A0A1X0IM40_MYCRH|nr:GMC family oxidoreductase [Mycolicibacterium rhodesiae]MCV7347634.1 GMC family oxidoreductase [Mycolicibacterium rhodesiae]ORB49255.1 glucose-methanol-choline oxidoreductase [Mycolicibacterium rhodesiae]
MPDCELTGRGAEHIDWDVIVVGAGMGGGMLGQRLARAGRRLLFVEKGRSTLPGTADTIRSAMPEIAEPHLSRSKTTYYDALARSGRSTDEITDISGRRPRTFVPFIGAGPGGSSALYGMVCERFFADDFTPRQFFTNPGESTVPESWPITYEQLAPWYTQAEKLLGVRGQPDPLRPKSGANLPAAPPFSPDNQPLVNYLSGRGLHPYHLPMACDYADDCLTCQAYLCPKGCKNDGGRAGVLPAVTEYGASLLDECRVVRLDAGQTRVQHIICQRGNDMLALRAKVVVLAAGALATPVLLLNSRSGDWPRGLANGSDMVGRNLMRHVMDWIEIWPQRGSRITAENKEIGLNDFYTIDGQKYGTVQSASSMASLAPVDMMMNQPGLMAKALRWASPVARPVYDRVISGGLVLAAIMEDLPYRDNRVLPSDRPSTDGRQRLRIQYRLHPGELARREVFLSALNDVLRPFRTLTLRTGENNGTLGHACGTVRFGADPATSVLDAHNRAHELENLYVADASFFPSSSGINPSLTVAANALRVAEHINEAHFAS